MTSPFDGERITEDKESISYLLRRLPYTAYDRAMHIPMHVLSHMLEGYQMSFGVDSALNEFEEFRRGGHNISIVCCRHTLTDAFYPALRLGREETQMDLTERPIRFVNRLEYVGPTSMDVRTEMVLEETSELLGVSTFKYVRVDEAGQVLRTPQAFIDRFDELSQSGAQRRGSLRIERYERAAVAHACGVQVAFSDLDSNYHVNHKGYLRFSFDAAAELSLQGKLKHIRGDIAAARVAEVESLYLADARAGDQLTLRLWDDLLPTQTKDAPILRCLIENSDGLVINQTTCRLAPAGAVGSP